MAWKIDPAHSHIDFSVRHMMITNVRGKFESFTGTVDFDENSAVRSSAKIRIEAASINTGMPPRDEHLRSADFLYAEKYPHLTFRSKRIVQLDESHGRIVGDLTIRDVTREVVLDVEYTGQSRTPWATAAGFSAHTKISRKDWGLNWNQALETGGWLVGDDIRINIELELIKAPEPVEQRELVLA